MTFEQFVFDYMAKALGALSTEEEENGISLRQTGETTISPWVEQTAFEIIAVRSSKITAADDKSAITAALRAFRGTNFVLKVQIESITAVRSNSPARWVYTVECSITHRSNIDWSVVK